MRFTTLIVSTVLGASAAYGDISNDKIKIYNQAVEAGTDANAIIKAAADLATEAIANPNQEDAVLLAYEAGAMMCLMGACQNALPAAKFVAQAPNTDPNAHPVATDRALLLRYSEWAASPKRQTRRTFDDALKAHIPLEPSMLSVKAFEARYGADTQSGKLRQTARSASEAGDHLRPVAELIPKSYVLAELTAAISQFNDNQDKSARSDIAHLNSWITQFRIAQDEPADWIREEEDRTYAWGLAMDAWYISSGRRGISEQKLDEIKATYNTQENPTTDSPEDADDPEGLPFCKGEMQQRPALRYKSSQVEQGFFGAVIVGFDIEDGFVRNPVIRASVPEERFETQALETISKWTWQPAEDQKPGETCRLSRTNIVLPMVFALD